MTENECIETLKMNRPFAYSELQNAVDMAIQALEKRMPKKPLHNGANWYRCPKGCEVHKKHFERDFYCPMCGQAIDWSE